MKSKPPKSNIIAFPSQSESAPQTDFISSHCKILMKTQMDHPLATTYEIDILEAARLTEFNAELNFKVELRHDQMHQTLLCGVIDPSYTKGIAIAMDPVSGAISDVLNGAGVLAYLTSTPPSPQQAIQFELRIQKFGKNHICSISVNGESIMYPAYIAGPQEVYNAVIGTDASSGSTISHRNASLQVGRLAKVA